MRFDFELRDVHQWDERENQMNEWMVTVHSRGLTDWLVKESIVVSLLSNIWGPIKSLISQLLCD